MTRVAARHRLRCATWTASLLVAACTAAPASSSRELRVDPWLGDDSWEVWICHVHPDATDPTYGGLPLRLDLTPTGVADALAGVTSYYDRLSHGSYRPVFQPGGVVTMAVDEMPEQCLERALDAAGSTTAGVLAVADAEHDPSQPGGFGREGTPCAAPRCTARVTRRGAYVGGADFNPRWGEGPPLDLVMHEIGHALGWPHSGMDATGRYTSALDVMSNSAAAREIDPERRDAAGTLALNLVTAGWLPLTDVAMVPAAGGTVTLQPSASPVGTRLAVVRIDAAAVLTVEVIQAAGLFSHLRVGGVAVHRAALPGDREIEPLVGTAPFTSLLQQGESLTTDNWRIEVIEAPAGGWTVRITPTP